MDINQKIQESSHSGAKLEVLKIKDRYVVKKTITDSITKNYDGICKQIDFATIDTPIYKVVSIPVLKFEKSQNLIITMPYIEGVGGELVAHKAQERLQGI